MSRLLTIGVALLVCGASAGRQTVSADQRDRRQPIDFDTQVVPVLTKAGCNAAACHGAAAGRGGFYLSLFGSNPAFDYQQIALALNSRRVNRAAPEISLLLRKPTGDLEHKGGVRFEVDSREYQVLRDWITAGAERQRPRHANSIRVDFDGQETPITLAAAELPTTLHPQVTVEFSDGESRDVTRWSRFEIDDEAMLSISANGVISVQRPGRGHVFVSFLDQVEVIPVVVAREPDQALESTYRQVNFIDQKINVTLKQLGLPAEPRAEDATLVRRVTLALTGELPTVERVLSYLADTRSDKYERYVDQLLESTAFDKYWAYRLSRYLRVNAPPKEPEVAQAIRQWLHEGLANERPWDTMMREMITATGDTHQSGSAAIHRLSTDPRSEAEYMSEVVLGIRLRCANCHDHPLDRWTQDDYHGLAAIFARMSRGRNVIEQSQGSVIHPATGEEAARRLPGDRQLAENEPGREAFASWASNEPRHLMARVTVNRLWQSMMGQGLVEPVDDLRISNPATHPELFDSLTNQLIEGGYQITPILRSIALSDTFRRRSNDRDPLSVQYHAAFRSSALEPALLLDAITQVTGIADASLTDGANLRARDQANPYFASPALDALGRCPLGDACADASNNAPLTLPTALHLINGELLNEKIENEQGSLAKLIEQGASNESIVRHFYLTGLSRLPQERELQFWEATLAHDDERDVTQGDDSARRGRRQRLQDFVWALLNSEEFRTIH